MWLDHRSQPCPATFRVPLVAPTIWNQLPVTFTGSLNVMVMFVLFACCVAPLVGVVAVTRGRHVDGEAEHEVGRHVVRRIVTILIGDLGRDDRHRASFTAAKSTFGLIVKVVGPPVTTVSATLRVPLVGTNDLEPVAVTFTGSLKVTVMFVFVA